MGPKAYYNEFDPKAAAWLRELIRRGLIAPGDVDTRSITEVSPHDLDGYTQCHFFAGIGGWSHALRLAGWDDDRPVWTGSCPCQPFSEAGKRRGFDDDRHLWPAFRDLIAQCRPAICFGEQVASSLGRQWLAGVRADLEALGYEVGAADLCAASVGAPHIRQRLYWVADAAGARCSWPLQESEGIEQGEGRLRLSGADGGHGTGGLADAEHDGGRSHQPVGGQEGRAIGRGLGAGMRSADGVRDAIDAGLEGHSGDGRDGGESGRLNPQPAGPVGAAGRIGFWSDFGIVACRDGKARRFEPASFPLAHGVPARLGRLRGYGNAIVPEVAEAFIRAYLDVIGA